jgi:hypothetical protein
MSNIQELKQKEDKLISTFQEIKKQYSGSEPDQETNINITTTRKRNNKKSINTLNPTENDLKKLAEKEQARKDKQKLYQLSKREKILEYYKEYSKTHRDTEKEKEYYAQHKEHIHQKSKINIRKYLNFYTLYKNFHPEFQKKWDDELKPLCIEKIKNKKMKEINDELKKDLDSVN